jgi:hypothetical protein
MFWYRYVNRKIEKQIGRKIHPFVFLALELKEKIQIEKIFGNHGPFDFVIRHLTEEENNNG